MSRLSELVALGRDWGRDALLIQGPGGNISVKDGDRMWIKSSGVLLKDIREDHGLTEVDWTRCLREVPPARQGFPSREEERAYIAAVGGCMLKAGQSRPSMETGFHAVIPHTWILHVHSLAGVLAGWLTGNRSLGFWSRLRESGVEVISIPPSIPGLQLTWEIRNAAAKGAREGVTLWLLENHGVIWSGDDLDAVRRAAEGFEVAARAEMALAALPIVEYRAGSGGDREIDFSAWPAFHLDDRALFPDYAVFFMQAKPPVRVEGRKAVVPAGFPEGRLETARELLFAQALLATKAMELGCYRNLPESLSRRIAELEIEAIRLKQAEGKQP